MTIVTIRNSLDINTDNIVLFEKNNNGSYTVVFADGTRLSITAAEYNTLRGN